MDKIIFPSILNNVIVNKDNLKIKHTREGQAEIETIEGRSEFIEESFSHVGELNQETNKYDIEITTSKEYENGYTEKSSSIISIDKPLKSTPSGLCDKIYKHGDNYKLLTQIGEKPFKQEYNKESLEKGESIVLENSNKNNLIEIEEIWGNTWQDDTDSVNLIHNFIGNYNLSTGDGTLMTDSACKCTDYIEVNPTESYYVQGTRGVNVCVYDENKTFISGMLTVTYLNHPSETKNNFSLPSNAKYIRASIRDVVTPYQIVKGTSALPYEPYHKADLSNIKHLGELYVDESGQPILDSYGRKQYKIEIESRDNIITTIFDNKTSSDNFTLTFAEIKNGLLTLKHSSTTQVVFNNPIILKPGETICLNLTRAEPSASSYSLRIRSNDTVLKNTPIDDIRNEIELNGNCKVIYTNGTNSDVTVTSIASYFGNYDISEILVINNYDKYLNGYITNKTSILLPCQLCKVGDVADRLYWDSEKGKYVIEKNVGVSVLSRDNNWIYTDDKITGYSRYYASKEDIDNNILIPTKVTTLCCNSNLVKGLPYEELFKVEVEGVTISSYGKISFQVLSEKANTVEEFNNLIDGKCLYYFLNSTQLIETNVLEQAVLPCYKDKTYIDILSNSITGTFKANLLTPKITDFPYIDEINDTISDGTTLLYPLPRNEITETDIEIDNQITTYGTDTTFEFNGAIPKITLNKVPNDYAYNESRSLAKGEVINVESFEDIDTTKTIKIKYIEGLENVGEYDEVSGKYKIEIISKGTNVVLDEKVIFLNNPLRKGDYILPNGNVIRGDSEDIEIIEDMPIMEFAVDGISCIDSNNLIKPIISASIPIKSIRKLEKPTEISIVSNEDKHTISWTGDKGVESYDIRLNDEIIQTVDYTNTSWINNNEMSGDITITAKNHLIESDKSNGLNILTIPNQCKLTSFDCIYKDNLYQMVIGFQKNSNIATGYKIKYILDNGEIVEEELTDLDNVVGQHQISLPVIEDKIDVKIYPYNKAGSNEYKDYKSFYVTPTPLWTYLTSNDNFLFRIKDRFNFETWYNLKTKSSDNMGRFDGSLDWNDYPIGGNEGIDGLLIDYTLQTHPEEELLVSAIMNDGEFNHIPSIPFRASKILDITLLAPKGFKMEWVDDGVAKFSWEDNYVNESYFEFSYSLNGGIEEHIRIDSSSVETDGKIYSYTYKFDEYGILSARVRMVWELNTSAYTDSKTATFVEVTGLPPSWIVKKYEGDNLVVSWEAQSYVEKYEVKIECDGATEILDIVQDMFNLDLNKYQGKDVRISIRTHFTTGLITEYSDSISFKPVSESQVINNISYRPIKVEKDNNVRITTKINEIFTSYQRVVNIINNESVLHTKICKEMIGVEALLNNTFYNIVNEKYSDNIMVGTPNVESKFNIYAKTYRQVEIDKLLNSYIYTPILSKFTDFMSIQKVTIVCIGDSITAGHPLYWAESNTGIIEAQYPYWLSKRLNGQYNVINKGFGSDRTYNVLARFKKDVLDLNPQYCIIQVGTND